MGTVVNLILPEELIEGTEATLSSWLFNVGDKVKEGEPVADLETDKVNIEVVAPCDGVLQECVVKAGDKVEPNGLMALIASSSDSAAGEQSAEVEEASVDQADADPQQPAAAQPAEGEHIPLILPEELIEGTEATLSAWLFKVGDKVKEGEPIADLETDKVNIEVVAPCDGILQECVVQEGEKVEPNGLMARIVSSTGSAAGGQGSVVDAASVNKTTADLQQPDQEKSAEVQRAPVEGERSRRHLLGPAVRRLLAKHDLDVERIPGSGRGGRITREDVLAYIALPEEQRPGSSDSSHSRMVPHNSMRKAIAQHMVESLLEKAPHVTSVFEMDMTNIIEHRKWHKEEFADKGVNLTFTAYFMAACTKAMSVVPEMNAQFHEDALEIFSSVSIGVGTALGDKGLVVPVVKDVDKLDLFAIAKALHSQTQRARAGKLTNADMKGGTFTISNHGVSGSLFAAPIIINQPQVAILGIGKMEKRVEVVTVNGIDEMRIRPKCYVSLSIDHRAVDAHQTNLWLSSFVECIENWGGVKT